MSDEDFEARFEDLRGRLREARRREAKASARIEVLEKEGAAIRAEAKRLGVRKVKGKSLAACIDARIAEVERDLRQALDEAERALEQAGVGGEGEDDGGA